MRRKKLKVMISHAGEDKDLAEAWKGLLGDVYGDATGIWFSNDPAGAFDGYQTFADTIVTAVRAATIVLTIQTPYSVHKPWVVWEAGLAKGLKKSTFVVTFGLKRGQLGNPLDAMDQSAGRERKSVGKVVTSIGKVAQQPPFSEEVFDRAWQTYLRKIQEANNALPVVTPAQYDKRIILRMPVETAVKTRDPVEILKNVNVVNNRGGLSLFGWPPDTSHVSWEQFYLDLKSQDKSRKWPGSASGWADRLDDVVHLVLGNKLGDAESLPLYLDEKAGIAYRPSINSRQQVNEFVDICITFNQLPDEITKRPSGRCGILSHLLDFCRMFRWGVLEREEFVKLFSGELLKSEKPEAHEGFLRALMNIRVDFQNRGLRKEDILDAFPEKFEGRVSAYLQEYYEVIESLTPHSRPTEEHMIECYSKMLRLNKEFYTLVYESFGNCIATLDDGNGRGTRRTSSLASRGMP